MAKLWQLKPDVPSQILDQFPELSRLEAQLLYNLGIDDPARVDWFLKPDYHNLYDPFLFTEMQKSVDRIWKAIFAKEKILIYGDYDADAVTANAVLTQTFRYLGVPVESYIPDRFTEGYGLNVGAFETIKASGVSLVITVDCGTNSCDVADFCNANGIDLIITDHHEITGDIPKSYTLVNPKNPQEIYPDKQITGVGVAYKLAKALLCQHELVAKAKQVDVNDLIFEWDKWLLDLVAIGTVADCHSLLGENRILVKFGLKVLQKTKWLGLRHLVDNAGLDFSKKQPDTVTLGFTIAPRINAAGRLEHANIALQLLIAEDHGSAIDLANQIEEINRRRQDITARIVSEAKERASLMPERKILMLAGEGWAKGVVGIVAGKLAETYQKPTIIMEKGEVESTGSARSVKGFDIVSALKSSSQYILKYGGHKEAAGLTVQNDNLDNLYASLLKYADYHMLEEVPESILELDAQLQESDLSIERAEEIFNLSPFGAGNPTPKFLIEDLQVVSSKVVGNAGQHLQLKILCGQTMLETIGFSLGYWQEKLQFGQKISLAGELLIDTWNGNKKLKLRLIDIKFYEEVNN